MPYAYALDYRFRNMNPEVFRQAIIIFDEAHNILDALEEGSSVVFDVEEVDAAIKEAENVKPAVQRRKMDVGFTEDDIEYLVLLLR